MSLQRFLMDLAHGIGQELFGIAKQTAGEITSTAAELTVKTPIAAVIEPAGAIAESLYGGSAPSTPPDSLDRFLDTYNWDGTQHSGYSPGILQDDEPGWSESSSWNDATADQGEADYTFSSSWDGDTDNSWSDDSGSDWDASSGDWGDTGDE